MKLEEKVSWLMGRLQRSLFPQLEQCCVSPLSEQEKHLVKVLEVIEIERHIPKNQQWTGRPAAERRAIGRSFVAKAVLGYPHTRSLINELRARPNLRLICGFTKQRDIPSESTFSRAFADFSSCELGAVVHDTLVQDYLQGELIGHVSRDSTVNFLKIIPLIVAAATIYILMVRYTPWEIKDHFSQGGDNETTGSRNFGQPCQKLKYRPTCPGSSGKHRS